ncbi:MAG: M36 family metallopeptidase [Burkholderiales bacterium]
MQLRPTAALAALALAFACSAPTPALARQLPVLDKGARNAAELDVPKFVWARDLGPIPKATATDPEGAARAYLKSAAAKYRMTSSQVDALVLTDQQALSGGGSIARFGNRVDGIEVFRDQVNVLVGKDGSLVSISGFTSGASTAKRTFDAIDVTAEGAIAAALAEHRFGADVGERVRALKDEGGYAWSTVDAADNDGATLAMPLRTKRVWFRVGATLVPAWYVEVQATDKGSRDIDAYSYVVSAEDASVLFRNSLTKDVAFSYRTYAESAPPYLPLPGPGGRGGFPHPTGTPNGYQAPIVPQNLVTLQNAPYSANDPWLLGAATLTEGNNVEAFANVAEPDGFGTAASNECNVALPVDGDLHACVTSGTSFDHTFDPNTPANANRTQVAAGVTNLFYTINYLHDWFYDAGFNEAAGNAQLNNYGRGGKGNDSIFAEAQDYSGTNNANMNTPPDGQRPRMRMYFWSQGVSIVRVNAPASLAGVKTSNTAAFGAQAFDLTAGVVVARDPANTEGPVDSDACSAITNAPAVAGKIALIDRGTCTFVVKAKNAQAAGAVAVIIVNNVSPGAPGMAGTDATITIPVLSISLADGAAIKAELAAGSAVTMRMGRQAGTPRDGSLDNTVIAHEWGHYLSNRLVNNSNGLVANQAGGMGEGWSDFVALLVFVKEEDRNVASNANFNGTYALTAYLGGGPDYAPDVLNNAYYYGIRRYPYSRDMSKNPLTFKHIADANPLPDTAPRGNNGSAVNSEVHNTGEVWANMLWECYSNLLNDTSRLTFAQAQDRMKRYLVASFKVTPTDPTFVQARDALLAVMQAQDATDADLCLTGFAKRGLGIGAVAPDSLSEDNAGVVESYSKTAGSGNKVLAIEYYNAGFDHYFITWVPAEIKNLDTGVAKGWTRTGQSFNVYSDAPAGTAAVCRIYIPPGKGDGHFFGRDTNECAGTMSKNPTFILESPDFFHLVPPSAGTCASGTVPVYRVFSNRADANHRYTTSRATRDQMVAKGWVAEGDGADIVVMCAPV